MHKAVLKGEEFYVFIGHVSTSTIIMELASYPGRHLRRALGSFRSLSAAKMVPVWRLELQPPVSM